MEQHRRRIIPKELFDDLVDEAIDDLRKTGLDPGEIYPILENFLGVQIAKKYVESLQKSLNTNKSTITPDPPKRGRPTKKHRHHGS